MNWRHSRMNCQKKPQELFDGTTRDNQQTPRKQIDLPTIIGVSLWKT